MSTGQMVGGAVEEELGDGREYMTAEELAVRLHMTLAWIYAETRAGRIPHLRLGRYVRYGRSTIAAWEREQEAGSV